MGFLIFKVIIFFYFFSLVSCFGIDEYVFYSVNDENRFFELIKNFRCMVCQNQNLYDSNSLFAVDVKKIIYNMIIIGENNSDIMNFMTDNYGEFVSYSPLSNDYNFVLWYFPIVLLFIGVVFFIFTFRSKL
ncbi:MAG: cytochrome c-type biogenesis protein CcmH [Enterobacteriaceae bacterium]|nr:cytochrome c-type biogenesis protein CcmH [Enterobacteriaceae bacterium]